MFSEVPASSILAGCVMGHSGLKPGKKGINIQPVSSLSETRVILCIDPKHRLQVKGHQDSEQEYVE